MTLTAPQPPQTGSTDVGHIVQIIGPVVDVEFSPEHLPEIYFALEIDLSSTVSTGDTSASEDNPAMRGIDQGGGKLVLEVQQHLGNNMVRAVAMGPTDGLRRGIEVRDTGAPISVPVGPATLGRLFNVLGEPIDEKPAPQTAQRYPIHRAAPKFEDLTTATRRASSRCSRRWRSSRPASR